MIDPSFILEDLHIQAQPSALQTFIIINQHDKTSVVLGQERFLTIAFEQAQAHRNQPLICLANESDYSYPYQEDFRSHLLIQNKYQLLQAKKELHPVDNIISTHSPQESNSSPRGTSKLRNSSIFHNFQKHLCAFLKRMIIIKENETELSQYKEYAIDLWNNFFKKQIYTKKNLYYLFGINTQKKKNELKTQSSQNKMKKNKCSMEVVSKANAILRQMVVFQCKTITKKLFLSQCRARNSQVQYSYFKLLIENLNQFSELKPMTKARLKTQSLNTQNKEV